METKEDAYAFGEQVRELLLQLALAYKDAIPKLNGSEDRRLQTQPMDEIIDLVHKEIHPGAAGNMSPIDAEARRDFILDQQARSRPSSPAYVGILLAAGRGRRFDPDGIRNKLLQLLPDGTAVVVQAARNLHAALASLLVVVPAEAPALAAHLLSCGFPVTECAAADNGMAASLVHGVRQAHAARGWIIALGDMPFVHPATIARIQVALEQGRDIVVPVYQGVRGNPVGFSHRHGERLLQLKGDRGARQLLQEYPVTEIEVEDPGIHRDIDTVADLQQNWPVPAPASDHL